MMKMRSAILMTSSFVLTAAVIANAWLQKQQFYPTVVYLTKSSPCLAVLYLQALVLVLLLGKFVRKVFFGQLRPAETERLVERSWYAITDTCLAFTMFRDDLNPLFVASFTLLLFLKCFHWLLEDRVDYMDRSPQISLLFKVRVVALLGILWACDFILIYFSYLSTMSKGPSVQLVFGFEYGVLAVVLLSIFCKFIFQLIDMQGETPWENKSVYLLYAALVTGFLRVVLYIAFTAIMVKVHTFPLFCIRPMYLCMREFKKAVSDIVLSRRAIQNMNTLYPDATREDLAASDSTCIICREEMQVPEEGDPPQNVNKKLPCGHMFHAICLRGWFQRQQSCPTCRMNVLDNAVTNRLNANNGAQANQQQAPQVPPAGAPVIPPPVPPPGANRYTFYPPPPQVYGMPPPPNMVPPPAAGPDGNPPLVNGQMPPAYPHPPSTGYPPMMPPPFPMMMPPSMTLPSPSPPSVPTDFSGMTDEQLRQMEGDERRAVERRIECLRDVQLLLDAAMCNINRYMTVQPNSMFQNLGTRNLNTVTSLSSVGTASTTTTAPSTSGAAPSTSGAATSSSAAPTSSEKTDDSSDRAAAAVTAATTSQAEESPAAAPVIDAEPDDDEAIPSSQSELRRRRLAKLEQAAAITNKSSADDQAAGDEN